MEVDASVYILGIVTCLFFSIIRHYVLGIVVGLTLGTAGIIEGGRNIYYYFQNPELNFYSAFITFLLGIFFIAYAIKNFQYYLLIRNKGRF